MKNYELTIQELLDAIQEILNGLVGKNVKKEGGIGPMVKAVLDDSAIDFRSYNINIDAECRLTMYCAGLNKDIEFANIRPTYKPDKRKWDGRGDCLERVTVTLTKDIPMDLKVINASQWLDFNEAKSNFDRLHRQQKELQEEYLTNLEAMKKMQEVMKTESYDKESEKEAEVAWDILREMPLK